MLGESGIGVNPLGLTAMTGSAGCREVLGSKINDYPRWTSLWAQVTLVRCLGFDLCPRASLFAYGPFFAQSDIAFSESFCVHRR